MPLRRCGAEQFSITVCQSRYWADNRLSRSFVVRRSRRHFPPDLESSYDEEYRCEAPPHGTKQPPTVADTVRVLKSSLRGQCAMLFRCYVKQQETYISVSTSIAARLQASSLCICAFQAQVLFIVCGCKLSEVARAFVLWLCITDS